MSSNELRKDYVLDRWVVIAAQRRKRPTDFMRAKEERKPSVCPFCPGNEHMTPPATLVYSIEGNNIKKARDEDNFRYKNWTIRCIPNLYPAFGPPLTHEESTSKKTDYVLREALGNHEVLIESPNHNEHPSVARISQLTYVVQAYVDRLRALSSPEYVKYVSIFRNHGPDAGASLSHAHTQMISTPMVPHYVEEELTGSKKYFDKHKKCVYCDVLEKERFSERFVWENESFVAIVPWAAIHPFEFWILPKRHQSTILDLPEKELRDLATTMRVSFGGLRTLLDDPSYNFGFHMIPEVFYHWHIEVYPQLAIWAGFEKSTGTFINVMSPEEAADNLREAFQKEENNCEF